ncbi:hypothetical protein AVEN_199492-1 [Araneus ventricosus]|uniref:SOCS box domain-containing protein n=1 Tax=Araneus ventricosus TaxID=182803 RepID=A0A4Y2GWB8_ARAVE|nr:hypothetical protein AVEN_81511-1 [Araneus ventricosus]GBM57115.1 hypothetical protein AVEN_199492-1 [Araneus ventricosus]
MDNFSINIGFGEVTLRTAADIVQHSFIVQDSISPLNLELCQSYILLDGHTNSDLPSFTYSKDLINSEEKCRNVLTSSRSLLYTLHLDFPKDKERSLKSDWISKNGSLHCRERDFHIAKIYIEDSFYTNVLSSHVDYACNRTDQNLRFLKWFIKSDVFVKPGISLPDNITNRIADCFHPALYDSEFLKVCSIKLGSHLINFLLTREVFKHQKRINFFYQFYRTGRMPEEMVWFEAGDTPSAGHLNEYLMEEISKYR